MDGRRDTLARTDDLMRACRSYLEEANQCIRSIYAGSTHLREELDPDCRGRIWKLEHHIGEALETARGYRASAQDDADFGSADEAIGEDDAVPHEPRYSR